MKSLLIRDKQFLKELYEGENFLKKKRLLTFANDAHLNTLLKLLHFLANGQIKIKKENFDKISVQKLNLMKKKRRKKKTKKEMLFFKKEFLNVAKNLCLNGVFRDLKHFYMKLD